MFAVHYDWYEAFERDSVDPATFQEALEQDPERYRFLTMAGDDDGSH